MKKNQLHVLQECDPQGKALLLMVQGERCVPMQKFRIQSKDPRGGSCIIRALMLGRLSRMVTPVLAYKKARAKHHEELSGTSILHN